MQYCNCQWKFYFNQTLNSGFFKKTFVHSMPKSRPISEAPIPIAKYQKINLILYSQIYIWIIRVKLIIYIKLKNIIYLKKWQAISEQEHSRKVRKQDVENCHTEIGQASTVNTLFESYFLLMKFFMSKINWWIPQVVKEWTESWTKSPLKKKICKIVGVVTASFIRAHNGQIITTTKIQWDFFWTRKFIIKKIN